MTPDNCPLCATSVALLRRPEDRKPGEIMRDRIAALQQRARDVGEGRVTPRHLKDEALWMCHDCQRVLVHLHQLEQHEVQRRIQQEVQRLERSRERPRRGARADGRERAPMKNQPEIAIVVEGVRSSALASHVRTKIAQALGRVDPPPTAAKVIFADENGPKGGPGIRCTIVHDMPRRRDFSVTEFAPSEEIAFDAAFEALETSVSRDRERRRELVRRPKKYFLAKRLLSPDATLDSPQPSAESPQATTGPRPKRTRRRRVA